MKHVIELTAKYKMGHQHFVSKIAVIGRNIVTVDEVPEEVPDHQDGILATTGLSNGRQVGVAESYDKVVELWHAALEHSL